MRVCAVMHSIIAASRVHNVLKLSLMCVLKRSCSGISLSFVWTTSFHVYGWHLDKDKHRNYRGRTVRDAMHDAALRCHHLRAGAQTRDLQHVTGLHNYASIPSVVVL